MIIPISGGTLLGATGYFYTSLNLITIIVVAITTGCGWARLRALTIGVILGATLAHVHTHHYHQEILDNELSNKKIPFTASVIKSEHYKNKSNYILRLNSPANIKVKAFSRSLKAYSGDVITGTIKLHTPHAMLNPGGFDSEKLFFAEKVSATGTILDAKLLTPPKVPFAETLKIQVNNLIIDGEAKSIINALTLGVKGEISTSTWDILRYTGTSHLLAISGLHVGMIAGLLFWVLNRLFSISTTITNRISAQRIAAILAIAIVAIYAHIAGWSLPTTRAFIMVTVALGAKAFGYSVLSWRNLAMALFLVLLIDISAVLGVGLWLSFGCVASLLLVKSFPGEGIKSKLKNFLLPQIIVFSFLFPVSIYFFGGVSLVSPLANSIAIPLVTIVTLPISLLGVILALIIPQLSSVCFSIAVYSIKILMQWLHFCANIPLSYIEFPHPPIILVLIGTIGVGILWLKPKKRVLGALMCLLLLFYQPSFDGNALKISFLEVGQGLAVICRTQNKTLLYDTGPSMGSSSAAARVILPYLNYYGIKKLDTVVLSHLDDDHAGGFNDIRRLANKVYTSSPCNFATKYKFDAMLCDTGVTWQWDAVEFKFINLPHKIAKNKNDASCVLQINAAGRQILLTGDLERHSERYIIDAYQGKLKSDILQIPHHGSTTSSSYEFVDLVAPEFAVVSIGHDNRFNFPRPEIMRRYEGSNIFRTTDGAITFKIANSGDIKVEKYRDNKTKWRV